MASEFDESLLGFLKAHRGLEVCFSEVQGGFWVSLWFRGAEHAEATGSGMTLDDAINAAVDDFEQRQGSQDD